MHKSPYLLVTSGSGRKFENVGGLEMVRPAAGAVWHADSFPKNSLEYIRFKDSSGEWRTKKSSPRAPTVHFDINDQVTIEVQTKLTSFGHLGFFAEQAQNWSRIHSVCKQIIAKNGSCKILNLFAYTGMSTMAAAKAGAEVTHVDASKTTVAWAKDLADLNGLAQKPIRWIVDDVSKYVARELRRGNTYDAVVLDPPSFGRGTKSEVWKIESNLAELMDHIYQLAHEKFGFVLLSAHSQGYTPRALENIQKQNAKRYSLDELKYAPSEMLIPAKDGMDLPSGACCWAMDAGYTL